MNVAIMQPYLFPYLGYFHLINAADVLILADDYQFSKKGWINRNRILNNGQVEILTLPLKKSSDFDLISEKKISLNYEATKFEHKIFNAYHRSPNFDFLSKIVNENIFYPGGNLYSALEKSIRELMDLLELKRTISKTSDFKLGQGLSGSEKIFRICELLGASNYVNLSGGRALYQKQEFKKRGITLSFIESNFAQYEQFTSEFIPQLSILDLVASISSGKELKKQISNFRLC